MKLFNKGLISVLCFLSLLNVATAQTVQRDAQTFKNTVTLEGSVVRASVQTTISAIDCKVGATAGFVVPSAHSGFTNSGVGGVAAGVTAGTIVCPVSGMKVGDTITAFSVVGQIESAGNTATVDADMRKLTVVAGDITDASIGGITQVSVVADTAVASSKTLSTPEVLAADEQVYVLLTVTTGASTDFQFAGLTVTRTQS